MKGLKNGAIPLNQRLLTITGFGTRKYISPIHTELEANESLRTVALRFYRGPAEPESVHQFCQPDLQNPSSELPGLVIEQPLGAFTLWKACLDRHGSSMDKRVVIPAKEPGSTGIVFTQKPYLLKHTNQHKDQTQDVVDIESISRNQL